MSDSVLVALIAAVPATIGVALGILNRGKLRVVEERLDGRLTELLELTRKAKFAEGVKHEADRRDEA